MRKAHRRHAGRRLIPAVFYGRYSTDEQGASVAYQKAAVAKYAEAHGYVIVRWYADEGVSGDDTERRADFLRMRDDARRLGDFEAILCFTLDRFGRFDMLDAGYWIKPIRDAGIRLVTCDKGVIDWSSQLGRLLYGLEQDGKQAVCRDYAKHAAGRMALMVEDGGWPNRPPYGYRLERRTHPNWPGSKRRPPGLPVLVPDEVTAEVARELFRRAARGETQGGLAASLNDRGILSPAGGRWSQSMVRCLLLNEAYLGRTVYGRNSRSKYLALKEGQFVEEGRPTKTLRHNDPEDWLVKEGTHEALVDAATFEAARRCCAANARRKDGEPAKRRLTTPGGGGFMLTGLIVCDACGYAMHGRRYATKRGEGRGYFCSGYHAHGRAVCRYRWVNEAFLVALISDELWATFALGGRASLESWLRGLLRQYHDEVPGDASRLRDELAAVARKVARGTERYLTDEGLSGELRKDLARQLESLKAHERSLREKLAAAERAESLRATADDRVNEFMERLCDMGAAAGGGFTPEQLRQTVAQVRVEFGDVGEKGSELAAVTVRWSPALLGADFPELAGLWFKPPEVSNTACRPCAS
jgi:DNA invertase Pin-like site-specific DNA recombinase